MISSHNAPNWTRLERWERKTQGSSCQSSHSTLTNGTSIHVNSASSQPKKWNQVSRHHSRGQIILILAVYEKPLGKAPNQLAYWRWESKEPLIYTLQINLLKAFPRRYQNKKGINWLTYLMASHLKNTKPHSLI